MKLKLRTLALPITLAATLVLAGCGTDHPSMSAAKTNPSAASNSPASKAKNKADVQFATMMIPHHEQAIAMAEMAVKQATDPKVKALAPNIKAAQGPEIERMSGWLAGWGEPVPNKEGDSHSSMGGKSGGMMSARQMTDLGKATGSTFDRMWLELMVKHHQGAVAMAKTALADGTNPEAKKLAQAIIDGQSTEITQMNSILTENRG